MSTPTNAALVASPLRMGMKITIYDPGLDPQGSLADAIVDFTKGALAEC